jgi:hypothetical protein
MIRRRSLSLSKVRHRVDCFVDDKSFAYHSSPRPIARSASLGRSPHRRRPTLPCADPQTLFDDACSGAGVRVRAILPWRKHGGMDVWMGDLLLLANIIAWNPSLRAQTRKAVGSKLNQLISPRWPPRFEIARGEREGQSWRTPESTRAASCMCPNSTRIKVHGAGVPEGPYCCYHYS